MALSLHWSIGVLGAIFHAEERLWIKLASATSNTQQQQPLSLVGPQIRAPTVHQREPSGSHYGLSGAYSKLKELKHIVSNLSNLNRHPKDHNVNLMALFDALLEPECVALASFLQGRSSACKMTPTQRCYYWPQNPIRSD